MNDQLVRDQIAAMREQLAALLKLRVEYGIMHCEKHKIGPTGGFCANINGTDLNPSGWYVDKPVCAKLAKLLAGKTVLDLGCGPGDYGKCLTAANLNISWTGFDGAEGIEAATKGYVKFADLSVPQYFGARFDWVLSLEVGEHLPAQYEAAFIGNIARHAVEGAVLTWAVPGQGGNHHVNERANSYVIERMAAHGFAYDEGTSQDIRGVADLGWFKHTMMVFRRAPG